MGRSPVKLVILTLLAILVQMPLFCGTAYGAGLTIDVGMDKFIDNSGVYPEGTSDATPPGTYNLSRETPTPKPPFPRIW